MTLPRVTDILRAAGLTQGYGFMGAADLLRYRARGSALHQAIKWYHEGVLDEASLHPEIRPGFEAYRLFCDDTGHVPAESELELTHAWGFVGHLDRVGSCGPAAHCVIDYKFSDSPDVKGARYQLAAYDLLMKDNGYAPAERRYVLALSPKGRGYTLHDVTDPHAEQVFTAAFMVYRAREEDGR